MLENLVKNQGDIILSRSEGEKIMISICLYNQVYGANDSLLWLIDIFLLGGRGFKKYP